MADSGANTDKGFTAGTKAPEEFSLSFIFAWFSLSSKQKVMIFVQFFFFVWLMWEIEIEIENLCGY